MTTIINGSSPSITFSDSTTQSSGVNTTNPVFTGDASISGLTVGKGGGAVSTNTAVGASALAVNTSGAFNTGLSYGALASNTTGQSNSAAGLNALANNTTGSQNLAFGTSALLSNTTASNNTAVGYQAGYSNTTSPDNTVIGYQAGYAITTGGYNTFVGVSAGTAVTTGVENQFFGRFSGSAMTTGSKNTILGKYSGNQGGLDIRTLSNQVVLSDGDGNPFNTRYIAGNVSTTAVDLSPSISQAGLHFVMGYNTANGAQGWWLIATRVNSVTTISSSNNTGLTVNFSQTASVRLNAATTSGTVNMTCFTFC